MAIKQCIEKGLDVDELTISLLCNDKLLSIKIHEIMSNGPNSQNVAPYVVESQKMLWANNALAKMRETADLIKSAKPFKPFDAIENSIASIPSFALLGEKSEKRLDEGLVNEYMDHVSRTIDEGTGTSIKTGINAFDDISNGGLRPGHLITIGARPGCGKTTMATNMALNIAKQGFRVQYFCIEMLKYEVIERFICADTLMNTQNVASKIFSETDWDKFYESNKKIKGLPITIECDTRGSIEALESLIRTEHRKFGLKVAFIDYIQQFKLTSSKQRYKSKREELEEITSRIMLLASELKITIVIMSQLNRDIERRADTKPTMADLKESGSIEADSHLVLILHNKSPLSLSGDVVKNRFGMTAPQTYSVDFSCNKIYEE